MKNKKFQYEIFRERGDELAYFARARAAFLLIEMMIALTLFATMAIIVACNQAFISDLHNQASCYLKAVNIATNMLEGNSAHNAPESFRVERGIKDFVLPTQILSTKLSVERLKKIKINSVKVSWNSSKGKVHAIVVDYASRIDQGERE